ncbi:SDR family NAD(P)-dependent oxidoreductase [Salinicoccus sp. Marseille-QA3877]
MELLQRLFGLNDKNALVIGIGGLGKEVAFGLAEAGANVAVADLSIENSKKVSKEIKERTGRSCLAYKVDITNQEQVKQMVNSVTNEFNTIDILVNAFGITKREPSESFSKEMWDKIIEVNLTGALISSQIVGTLMIKQGSGSIINLSSIAGEVGFKGSIAYAASKGAVNQITRTMAVEWASRGVRVNAVAPSWTDTEMGLKVFNDPELYKHTIENVPKRRLVKKEEVIGAVILLASDASKMITGHILPIDGGFLSQ